jgi:NNP family nitrate/nitrite transporter-like MFS transporter
LPFYVAIFVLFLIMANGAVFQLVPQRFGKDMGIMTGLVGCAGGLKVHLMVILLVFLIFGGL